MRNSLLAILIAFGATAAMPANACCVPQKDAGKGITTGIAGTAKAAPSETNQRPQMNTDKNVTTGSTAGTTKAAPSETSGDLAAKYRSMTDTTVGTGPG
jgi:hypothetical protein